MTLKEYEAHDIHKLNDAVDIIRRIFKKIKYFNFYDADIPTDSLKEFVPFLSREKEAEVNSAHQPLEKLNICLGYGGSELTDASVEQLNSYILYFDEENPVLVKASRAIFGGVHGFYIVYSDDQIMILKDLDLLELEDVQLCDQDLPYKKWMLEYVRDKVGENQNLNECYIIQNHSF